MSDELTDLGFLIDREFEHRGVLHPKTSEAVKAAFEKAVEHLVSGGSVNLPGVGLLYSRMLKARKVAVNFKRAGKGMRVEIEARRALRIEADDKFKSDLQAGKVVRPHRVSIEEAIRRARKMA